MKNIFALLLFATTAIFAAEPAPVGHWKLDDKTGDTVIDSSSSKNNAKAMHEPARVEGKLGGAFSFDGKKSYVEIPNAKEIDKLQMGSYTVGAWFKAESVPPGATDEANDSNYGIVCRTGFHEGLTYSKDKKFIFTHWVMDGDKPVWTGTGAWETEYEPGTWHHVVGVVDKAGRVAKIYVDGELKGTTDQWDEKAAPGRDYGTDTWKIGVGRPAAETYAWHAKAAIDDVRLYNLALTDDQVKTLYDATSSGKDK